MNATDILCPSVSEGYSAGFGHIMFHISHIILFFTTTVS